MNGSRRGLERDPESRRSPQKRGQTRANGLAYLTRVSTGANEKLSIHDSAAWAYTSSCQAGIVAVHAGRGVALLTARANCARCLLCSDIAAYVCTEQPIISSTRPLEALPLRLMSVWAQSAEPRSMPQWTQHYRARSPRSCQTRARLSACMAVEFTHRSSCGFSTSSRHCSSALRADGADLGCTDWSAQQTTRCEGISAHASPADQGHHRDRALPPSRRADGGACL